MEIEQWKIEEKAISLLKFISKKKKKINKKKNRKYGKNGKKKYIIKLLQITVDLEHSDILYEVLRSCNLRHNSSFILFHTSSMYRDIFFHSRTISFEIHYSTW